MSRQAADTRIQPCISTTVTRKLPARFYTLPKPVPVSAPGLIRVNAGLSRHLGIDLDWLASAEGVVVIREPEQPGGVLAPVAQSHIRLGTFQFFAARQDRDALRLLADHVIQRHYPQAAQAANPYLPMLDGVMNTDDMPLSGGTIDCGPCAFMGAFDPAAVFSYIDWHGCYAYRNQPAIAHWNLAGLAEALLPPRPGAVPLGSLPIRC